MTGLMDVHAVPWSRHNRLFNRDTSVCLVKGGPLQPKAFVGSLRLTLHHGRFPRTWEGTTSPSSDSWTISSHLDYTPYWTRILTCILLLTRSIQIMNKPISLALLVGGIILIVYGISASNSTASGFSRFFSGNPTDRTMWLLIGFAIAAVIGTVGLVRGSKAP